MNTMRASLLRNALKRLGDAVAEAKTAVDETKTVPGSLARESDPLAAHIFASRRQYQTMSNLKSGKRKETASRISWQEACDLGFRGDLGEWELLLGAGGKR